MITSIFPTVCTADVGAVRDFYVGVLGFEVVFDSGWYAQLAAPGAGPQIGVVQRDHDSVPAAFRRDPAGVLVSVEVDDVDAVHDRVRDAGLPLPLTLREEDFGQRHFMTVDPAGTLVDVITPTPPSTRYAALYQEPTGER